MNVTCSDCDGEVVLSQPHAYHAGFANSGFLYDGSGTKTLEWSTFDEAFSKLVGAQHPWSLNDELRELFENDLNSKSGDSGWLFSNKPRCPKCGGEIGESILNTIYYFVYPDSYVYESGTISKKK